MEDEIRRIRKKARPKIIAILNTRRFYDTGGLIQQYKAHVLCLLEQSCVSIYHASQTHLEVYGIHMVAVGEDRAQRQQVVVYRLASAE